MTPKNWVCKQFFSGQKRNDLITLLQSCAVPLTFENVLTFACRGHLSRVQQGHDRQCCLKNVSPL